MASERPLRNRLIGFRVTEDEHDLLCRYALAADERTVTGMLRKLLAETIEGFGATTERRTTTTPGTSG